MFIIPKCKYIYDASFLIYNYLSIPIFLSTRYYKMTTYFSSIENLTTHGNIFILSVLAYHQSSLNLSLFICKMKTSTFTSSCLGEGSETTYMKIFFKLEITEDKSSIIFMICKYTSSGFLHYSPILYHHYSNIIKINK